MSEKIITLQDRKIICKNTLAMWFKKPKSGYEFIPGQYAKITLLDPVYNDDEGNSRFFSIASSPGKDYFLFTTRALDSAFNKNILKLPSGSKATISEPGGNTPLHKDASIPAVFIIGGIGITPVRCIVEYATENKIPYNLTLFYSNPDSESMAFLSEFENWANENPGFKFYPTIDDKQDKNWKYDTGYINEDILKKNITDIDNSIYYIIGPPQMVDSMTEILKNFHVKDEKIKYERF